MNNVLYCFLLAAVSNIDNMGIRIAYGIKGIKISASKCLWISVMTFAVSAVFAGLGLVLSGVTGSRIADVFSVIILIVSGVAVLWCVRGHDNHRESSPTPAEVLGGIKTADTDRSHDIDMKEATLLGIALSINNAGGALGGGFARINWLLFSLLSAVLCFLALTAGNMLCRFFLKFNLERKAAAISGGVLVLLGLYKLFASFMGA